MNKKNILLLFIFLLLVSSVSAYNFPTPIAVSSMDTANLGYDNTENGHNGTVTGVVQDTTTKKWGASSGYFTDDDIDYGTDPFNSIGSNSYSIMFAINTTSAIEVQLVSKYLSSSARDFYLKLNSGGSSGVLRFVGYNNVNGATLEATTGDSGINDGSFHCVGISFDSGVNRLAIMYDSTIGANGTETAGSHTWDSGTASFQLGNIESAGFTGVTGQIDEFTVIKGTAITIDNLTAWCGSGGYANYSAPPAPSGSNFTINMSDSYNSSLVTLDVDMLHNGTIYNFSGTHIDTGILNSNSVANITIYATGYEPRTWINYNINNDLSDIMNLTLGRIVFNSNLKNVVNGDTISNYTINLTNLDNATEYSFSTNGEDVVVYVPKNESYEIFIDANNYALYYFNQTYLQEINITLGNIYLYETNSIYINFLDEQTGNLIDYKTIYLDIISDLYANNYSTATGELNITLLIPENYLMRYYADGYALRFYEVEVLNKAYRALTLYLLNSTNADNVTINIIDQNTQLVSGAVIKALKYNLSTNSYILMERATTDENGQAVLSVLKDSEFYKFMISYDGVLLKTTSPAYLTEDEYTIQINIGNTIGEVFQRYESISFDLSFNDLTNNFRLNYDDSAGFTSRFCLFVYSLNGGGSTLYNSSCSYSGSATLLAGVAAVNGSSYIAKAFYYDSEGEHFLDDLNKEYSKTLNLGKSGLFVQLLVTIAVGIGIAIYSLPLALVSIPVSLLLGNMMGLIAIPSGYLIILLIVNMIIATVLWRKT